MPTENRSELVQSLTRGLEVIRAFGGTGSRGLTLSEVASRTGLTRATSRRILLTLKEEGYLKLEGRTFSLTPRILELGYAYISSLDVWELCQPHMRALVDQLNESSSLAVLDLPDVVYVARVPVKRIMAVTLAVGSRLPAHATSMGHVLLANLPEDTAEQFVRSQKFEKYTPRTITDPDELMANLRKVRKQGWALLDQELDIGLRSIAVPVHRPDGSVVAAMNVAVHSQRSDLDELRTKFLPALLAAARKISEDLGRHAGLRELD